VAFPTGWPPPPAPARGPSLRFFVEDSATASFEDRAYIFSQQGGANPLKPLPVVSSKYTPDHASAPVADPAPSATAVHAAVREDAANEFPGAFTSPSIPRNLTVTFAAGWQGGAVTVVGTDIYDQPQNEVFASAPGFTIAGLKTFKTVTAASKAAVAGAADTASIGTGPRTVTFADVPQNPAGMVKTGSEPGYLYSSTIRIVNDEAAAGVVLEVSFDGVNVHGSIKPTEQLIYRGRAEAGIAVRGNGANFRIEAW
jgi:hypothetical protein